MIISIQRFQRPSAETPTTATLLYQLHEGPIGESEGLRTFRRVLSVLLTSLAILVMTIFTVQSPTITPAALYTAIFFVLLYSCVYSYVYSETRVMSISRNC
ncbi:putative inner membrane protein [Chlamydia psittaci Mat116]|nr:putative inner membrane protein [Chlamydia psittaci Mat116]